MKKGEGSSSQVKESPPERERVVTQFYTECHALSSLSLQCSINNRDNLEACEEHFEVKQQQIYFGGADFIIDSLCDYDCSNVSMRLNDDCV